MNTVFHINSFSDWVSHQDKTAGILFYILFYEDMVYSKFTRYHLTQNILMKDISLKIASMSSTRTLYKIRSIFSSDKLGWNIAFWIPWLVSGTSKGVISFVMLHSRIPTVKKDTQIVI